MGVRYAGHADVPAIRDLLMRLHANSVCKDIEICDVSAVRALRRAVQDARLYLGVYERQQRITAALMGSCDEYWWSRATYATDLVFYSENAGDGIRVAKHFVSWARQRGAKEITLGVSSGLAVERTEELYQRIGLNKIGGMYMRILQ